MSDIHALSGAYAVDALDDLERAAFERHLAACAACGDEVDGLREASSFLSGASDVPAPARLRDRVLADVAVTRPLAPLTRHARVPSLAAHRTHRARRRPLTLLVAAAAAVVAIGGGAVVVDQLRPEPAVAPRLSAADRVLQSPDAQRFTTAAKGGGQVTVVRSTSLNQAVLMTEGLAEPPAGKTHELWLKHDNVYIPAGFLDAGSDRVVLLDGDPASAQAFGLSVEPMTGSTEPSDDIVALLDFSDA